MSNTRTLSLGSRLSGGASWAFTKVQVIPPLVALPAVGLAAWFATPYALQLAAARGAHATTTDVDETGGTTATQRSDPVAQVPSSASGAAARAVAVPVASLLTRPISASAIPSWLPLPAPAPAPKPQPAQPRVTATYAAPRAPRPAKTAARLIAPMPQQQVAARQPSEAGFAQRRSAPRLMESFHHAMQTGRSTTIGGGLGQRGPVSGGYQLPTNVAGGYRAPVVQRQWTTGGGYRGPIMQSGVSGSRGFGTSGFSNMRGGGGFSGFRGGGHR